MQNELDFEVNDKFQVQFNSLKKNIDSLDYSLEMKENLLDFYFKLFVDIVQHGKFIRRKVAHVCEWEKFKLNVDNTIEKYSNEMINKEVKIEFEIVDVHEDEKEVESMIAYYKKINEKEYDDILNDIIHRINSDYHKDKREHEALKRKFT